MVTEGSFATGRALRRGWWIVAGCVLVAVATAAVSTYRETPTYRATATVVVVPSDSVEGAGDVLRSLETLERRTIVATFARIPSNRGILDRIAGRMDVSPDAIRSYHVRASVVPYTNAIEIAVTGPDRDRARDVAAAAAEVTAALAAEMYPIFEIENFEAAAAERDPVEPNPRRNLAVATLLGLFAGLAAAIGLEYARGGPRESAGR